MICLAFTREERANIAIRIKSFCFRYELLHFQDILREHGLLGLLKTQQCFIFIGFYDHFSYKNETAEGIQPVEK